MIIDPTVNLFLRKNSCILELYHTFPKSTLENETLFFEKCVILCKKLCPAPFVAEKPCIHCVKISASFIRSGILKSSKLSDVGSAAIAITLSVVVMVLSLFFISKIMSNSLKNHTSNWIKKALLRHSVVAILLGAVITMIMQSSSVTTSTLVPLVAMEVITIEQMLPLTLGANVGTTVTSFIAAISEGEKNGIQISICHFLFNFLGVLIVYPIPYLRSLPIECGKALGYQVKKRRIFGILYTVITFFVIPLVLLGLSIWNVIPLLIAISFLYSGLIFAYVWRQIRIRCPDTIPLWCPNAMKPNNREQEEIEEEKKKYEKLLNRAVH